jgi:hypothetical protein
MAVARSAVAVAVIAAAVPMVSAAAMRVSVSHLLHDELSIGPKVSFHRYQDLTNQKHGQSME